MEDEAFYPGSDAKVGAASFMHMLSDIIGCKVKELLHDTGVGKDKSKKEVFEELDQFYRQRTDGVTWEDKFLSYGIRDLAITLKLYDEKKASQVSTSTTDVADLASGNA